MGEIPGYNPEEDSINQEKEADRELELYDRIDELHKEGKISFSAVEYMAAIDLDPKKAIDMADEYWNIASEEGRAIIDENSEKGKKVVVDITDYLNELSKKLAGIRAEKEKAA